MFSTMFINQSHQPFDPKSRLSNSRGAKSDVASKHEKASLKNGSTKWAGVQTSICDKRIKP